MNALLASLSIGVTLSTLLLSGGLAEASGFKVHNGTLACGGNHFSRLAGSEQHRTSYTLRNFSGYGRVTIESIQVFDANGNVLFDFPSVNSELPAGVKTDLGPHETTLINTADILFADLGSPDRPIQTHVEWSYAQGKKDIPLNGSSVRTVRAAETGAEQSRASSECKLIDFRR